MFFGKNFLKKKLKPLYPQDLRHFPEETVILFRKPDE